VLHYRVFAIFDNLAKSFCIRECRELIASLIIVVDSNDGPEALATFLQWIEDFNYEVAYGYGVAVA